MCIFLANEIIFENSLLLDFEIVNVVDFLQLGQVPCVLGEDFGVDG